MPEQLPTIRTLPTVAVIVPVYHDWDRAARLCHALTKQTLPQHRFTITLVDNGDTPAPEHHDWPANAVIVSEPAPGSYAARNRGLASSSGEIVAFTDADCLPEPDWLANAVRHLVAGDARVAGHVGLTFSGENPTPAERYEKAFAFEQERYVARGTCVTANLVAWRWVFERVGAFDASLLSGGDMEWGVRARKAGIGIVYRSDVVVLHPARRTLRSLLSKRKRTTAGAEAYRRSNGWWAIARLAARRLLPPTGQWWKLKTRGDLSPLDRLVAIHVYWLLSVYGSVQLVLLASGLRSPSRV